MKLRLIADHPRISPLVKAVCYSGKMFHNAHLYEDIDQWSEYSIGQGFAPRYRSAIRRYSRALTPLELQMHYQKFCAHHYSEELVRKYEIETQDLTSIIAKLPQLDEVCFARGENHIQPNDDSVSLDQFSSVAQETLVEPEWLGGFEFHAGQFTALLKAAHTLQRPLHTIKAFRVPWCTFQQSKKVSDMMTSATKACQHLQVELVSGPDQENGRANLARMISSSPYLHTLEISFNNLFGSNGSWIIMLSEMFEAGAHWPNLERLKLGAMKATDTSLMNLLTTHATSIRSLELADIYLEGYRRDEKEYHGSWVDIILFLQRSLSLQTVRLSGFLSNGLDEIWCLLDPDQSDYWRDVDGRPEEGSCLKHRIEQFVVEGGTCPLPMPHEAKESGGWDCINFGEDSSWALCSDILRRY